MAVPPRDEQQGKYRVVHGRPIFPHDGRPDPETGTVWYRHDKVLVRDGAGWRELDGSLQTTYRRITLPGGRVVREQTTTVTLHKGVCVTEHNIGWLVRQNEEDRARLALPESTARN